MLIFIVKRGISEHSRALAAILRSGAYTHSAKFPILVWLDTRPWFCGTP
jgi:hypothetical protein